MQAFACNTLGVYIHVCIFVVSTNTVWWILAANHPNTSINTPNWTPASCEAAALCLHHLLFREVDWRAWDDHLFLSVGKVTVQWLGLSTVQPWSQQYSSCTWFDAHQIVWGMCVVLYIQYVSGTYVLHPTTLLMPVYTIDRVDICIDLSC